MATSEMPIVVAHETVAARGELESIGGKLDSSLNRPYTMATIGHR